MANRWGNSVNSDRRNFGRLQSYCSHEIKRHLLLGRKVMTNLDSMLKSRDITLPTKVCVVKAMVSPVVMYGCESWTIKKPECQRIDDFELWCWRRLSRVPWTARRSNQSILKEISPEYSLEGLMLTLKLQYLASWCKEVTPWKRPWCWERLGAGGEGDDRGWDGWMASPNQWTWVWVNSGSWWWTGKPGVLQSMGSQRVGHDWVTELNWTELCFSHSRSRSKSREAGSASPHKACSHLDSLFPGLHTTPERRGPHSRFSLGIVASRTGDKASARDSVWAGQTRRSTKENKKRVRIYFITRILFLVIRNC